MQQHGQLAQRLIEIDAARAHLFGQRHQCGAVAGDERIEHEVEVFVTDGAQHVEHILLDQPAGTMGDRLVEQRQRVAHRSGSALGNRPQCRRLVLDLFGVEHGGQVTHDRVRLHLLQVELQAAAQHRDRNLLRIGRREDEFHMLGRLFERLQHRVEGVTGQHVDFVDHVDLVAAARRGVSRLFEQGRHVVDAAVGRSVHLDVVNEATGVDLGTGGTDAARFRRDAGVAVQTLGENAGDRRLADAACAGEQIGVMQALLFQGMGQRAHDVVLTDQRVEAAGTPLAR